MNTQQLVEIQMIREEQCLLQRQLEEQKKLLEKQSTLIDIMSKDLEDKNKKITSIREVVWQLVSGLYDIDEQESVVNVHEHILLNKEGLCPLYNPDESIWPTTRQGDLQTKQINDIRKVLDNMLLNLEINKIITKKKGDTYYKLLYKNMDENKVKFYISSDSSNDENPFSQENFSMEMMETGTPSPYITNVN